MDEWSLTSSKPNIELYSHMLKVVTLANAFRSSHFETTSQNHEMPKTDKPDTASTGNTLDHMRRFLIQYNQYQRPTASLNPNTSLVPLQNRTYLSHDSGKGSWFQRTKRSNVVRAAHAKEDAAMYKQPLSVLWESFIGSGSQNTMSGFNSIVEERIHAARREGLFDNLKGRGKPLNDDDERQGLLFDIFVHGLCWRFNAYSKPKQQETHILTQPRSS